MGVPMSPLYGRWRRCFSDHGQDRKKEGHQTFDDETGGTDCSRCPRSWLKIPIIIDTNVLISGYLWSGKPRQVIKIVSNPPYEILYCHESLTELVRILSEKFYLAPDEIIRIVSNIKRNGKQMLLTNFFAANENQNN
jgi:hypothetical protein